MTKHKKVIIISATSIIALGALAAFAGPVIYRDFIAPQAAPAPTISAPSPSPSAPQVQPAPTQSSGAAEIDGEWQIGSGSTAGYRVNEVLNGTQVTVTGRTDQVAGVMQITDLTLVTAEFTVDVAAISTDSGQRDRHFRDSALRTAQYPTATFVLTQPVDISAVANSQDVGDYVITGDLTLAGVTQSVSFTAQALAAADSVEIAGQIPITFADFGVTAPKMPFVSVEDEGFVEFFLLAKKV